MPVLPLLLLLGTGPRLQMSPELEVGAGYDDNLFLNPDLAGAASTAVSDAVLHLEPRLPLLLRQSGHQLTLLYDGLVHEPLSGGFGTITDQLGILEYRTPELILPAAPVILRVSAIGERYDATFTSDGAGHDNYDAFWLGGGEGGFDFVGRLARIGAAYRYSNRAYINREQDDREQKLSIYYDARPVPNLSAGAVYAYTHISSQTAGAPNFLDGLSRHRLALPLRFVNPDLSVRAEPSLTLQTLPRFLNQALEPVERHDVIFGIGLGAQYRLTDSMDAFARIDLLRASSDDDSGKFARDLVLVGVVGRFSAATGGSGLPEPAPPDEKALAPRVMPGGKMRFRVHAPGAHDVALVADWNDWKPIQLIFFEDDTWEINVFVPPGRHTYSFLADGRPMRPPEAEAYVSDGFGGQNGVLTVGQ